MKCNVCGNLNPKGAQFCNKCGAKLGLYCPNCSSEIEKEDLFCKKCGNPLEKSSKKTPAPPAVTQSDQLPAVHNGSAAVIKDTKPKRKIPLWLLIVLGVIVVLCVVVAITGGFSFNIGNVPEGASPTTAVTITPIIVPTATQAATATLAPTPTPTYAMGHFDPFCDPDTVQFLFEHQPVSVHGFVLADEADVEPFFQNFMDNTEFNSSFDGEEIAPLMKFYEPETDPWSGLIKLRWGFEADPLPVGTHLAESKVKFTGNFKFPASQGGFEAGPGTQLEEINFQCPLIVGAPQADWGTILYSDFSVDQGVFEDKPGVLENVATKGEEGKQGEYLLSLEVSDPALNDNFYGLSRSPVGLPLLSDLVFSVDQEVRSKVQEAIIGICIRKQSGGGAYYLEMYPDTRRVTFSVIPLGSNEQSLLWEGESEFINQVGMNNLTLVANGSNFAAWINQHFLFFLEDSSILDAGTANICNTASGFGVTEIAIDNLLIRAPLP
jgi:hypothetical protein